MREYGVEDMPFVVVPHPMGGISREAVRAKADAAFPDIIRMATAWKAKAKLVPQKPVYSAERFKFKETMQDFNKWFFENGYPLL
jgi:hypothetical protein